MKQVWWFTWAAEGSMIAKVEVYDTMEETYAKWFEALPKAIHISVVEEHIGEELDCAHKAVLFWSQKGAYGRIRLPGDKR